MDKRANRQRRARKTRMRIRAQTVPRLCVHRTPRHIYAQIISPEGGATVVSASTLERDIRTTVSYGGNVESAKVVGRMIAERARAAGIEDVAFDRSGFRYHGRVQALADAAREAGLRF